MLPVREALQKAADFDHLLPDGVDSVDHHFWTVFDEQMGSEVTLLQMYKRR